MGAPGPVGRPTSIQTASSIDQKIKKTNEYGSIVAKLSEEGNGGGKVAEA